MIDPERVWAIVPVKPLELAKSRLAVALGPMERRALCLGMLEHVLAVLAAARCIGYRAVVSPDPGVLSIAQEGGGLAIRDPGFELNDALRLGVDAAVARGAEAVVILPGDLPLLRGEELHRLVARAVENPCVVVTRAAADGGTNALLVRPPRALLPCFGPNSFEAHCRQARERGIPLRVFEAPGISFDVDTPESLAILEAAGAGGVPRRLRPDAGSRRGDRSGEVLHRSRGPWSR